jgi:hypothetical protein
MPVRVGCASGAGGLDALRSRTPHGRDGSAGRQAVSLAKEILEADGAHDQQWTLGRLRTEAIRRGGPALSESRLAKLLKNDRGSVVRLWAEKRVAL